MPVHVPMDLDDWMRDRNFGSSRGPASWRWPACVKVNLEVVRGGCTNVHLDWCHADLIAETGPTVLAWCMEPAQGVEFGFHVAEVGDSASGVDHTLPDDVSGSVQSRDDDRVEYIFIQNRFHPVTLSSKHDFIQ